MSGYVVLCMCARLRMYVVLWMNAMVCMYIYVFMCVLCICRFVFDIMYVCNVVECANVR